MRSEDVRQKLKQEPFRPFRMHLTDGSVYEVRHPELILLGRRALILGLTRRPDQTEYDTAVDIDLMHIVRMDYLNEGRSRSARRSNGE